MIIRFRDSVPIIGKPGRWRISSISLYVAALVSGVLAMLLILVIMAVVLLQGPHGDVIARDGHGGRYRLFLTNGHSAAWVRVGATAYYMCPVGTYYPTCVGR